MTSQPDKIFRDHLGQYQKPAPSSAWERIEAGLERRQSKTLWIKIAASVIVLAAASILLWPRQEVSGPSIVQNPDQPAVESHITPTPSVHEPTVSQPVEEPHKIVVSKSNSPKTINQQPNDPSGDDKNVNTVSPVTATLSVAESNESEIEIEPVIQEITMPTEAKASSLNAPVSSTLVYSIDEVKSRFVKKTAPSKATPAVKNTSGFKKVIDIAYNLKHNDSLYGDLREKKNEILGFGFLDDKQGSER